MDPLLLEALRFGVAILAGGIVAVISSVLAFRYAQKLQQEEAHRRDTSLRQALVAEMKENVHRLRGPVVEQVPAASVVRIAWDAARALPLGPEVFQAIADAYMHGAHMERWVEILLGRATITPDIEPGGPEDVARLDAIERATRRAQIAYDAFVNALALLEKSDR